MAETKDDAEKAFDYFTEDTERNLQKQQHAWKKTEKICLHFTIPPRSIVYKFEKQTRLDQHSPPANRNLDTSERPASEQEKKTADKLFTDYVNLELNPNGKNLHRLDTDLSSLYGNKNLSEERINAIIEKRVPPLKLSKVNTSLPKLIINEEYPKLQHFLPRILNDKEIYEAANRLDEIFQAGVKGDHAAQKEFLATAAKHSVINFKTNQSWNDLAIDVDLLERDTLAGLVYDAEVNSSGRIPFNKAVAQAKKAIQTPTGHH